VGCFGSTAEGLGDPTASCATLSEAGYPVLWGERPASLSDISETAVICLALCIRMTASTQVEDSSTSTGRILTQSNRHDTTVESRPTLCFRFYWRPIGAVVGSVVFARLFWITIQPLLTRIEPAG